MEKALNKVPGVTAAVGEALRVRIRARDIAIALTAPADISVLNVLHGEVVDVQELALRRAGAPGRDLGLAGLLRLVEAADQGRQHVGVLRVVVVTRAVKVGRHRRDEITAVLVAVGTAHFNAGDLGDGIRPVGRLQRSSQQVFLFQWLRCVLRIDAG